MVRLILFAAPYDKFYSVCRLQNNKYIINIIGILKSMILCSIFIAVFFRRFAAAAVPIAFGCGDISFGRAWCTLEFRGGTPSQGCIVRRSRVLHRCVRKRDLSACINHKRYCYQNDTVVRSMTVSF